MGSPYSIQHRTTTLLLLTGLFLGYIQCTNEKSARQQLPTKPTSPPTDSRPQPKAAPSPATSARPDDKATATPLLSSTSSSAPEEGHQSVPAPVGPQQSVPAPAEATLPPSPLHRPPQKTEKSPMQAISEAKRTVLRVKRATEQDIEADWKSAKQACRIAQAATRTTATAQFFGEAAKLLEEAETALILAKANPEDDIKAKVEAAQQQFEGAHANLEEANQRFVELNRDYKKAASAYRLQWLFRSKTDNEQAKKRREEASKALEERKKQQEEKKRLYDQAEGHLKEVHAEAQQKSYQGATKLAKSKAAEAWVKIDTAVDQWTLDNLDTTGQLRRGEDGAYYRQNSITGKWYRVN